MAVAALVPARAGATKIAAVVRGAGAGSDKAAGFVAHAVRYSLTEDGRYEVVDAAERLGAEGGEQTKAFADCTELVNKATAAYETLDLDPAVDHLTAALKTYEKNASALVDIKPVADALMLLGAVHILRGEEKTGADRLAQAVAIQGSVEPDPRVFNPSMRQVFQKAADQVLRKAKGSLAVTSSPGYAELWVDGVFRGVTPTSVDGLTPGRHYVRLVRDGYRSWGSVVAVAPGKEAGENGVLRPTPRLDDYDKAVAAALDAARRSDPAGDAFPGAVGELEALLGVEQVFLAEVRLDGEKVGLLAAQYDLKGRRHLKTATHVFSYDVRPEVFDREVSELLRTQFGETTLLKRAAPAASTTPPPAPEAAAGQGGSSGTRRLALWGGVGGGAVVAGVGGLMYVLARRDHSAFAGATQVSPEAASLESSGKAKALAGDILVPLGLLGVGLGLGYYLLASPSPGVVGTEVEPPAVRLAVLPLTGGGAIVGGFTF
jgi:hypothetical protein